MLQLLSRPKISNISLRWPLITSVAACVGVVLPQFWHPWINEVAWFLSWPGYNGWLVLSILFLVLPFTFVFPSVKGELSKRFWPVFDVLIFAFLASQAAKYVLRLPRPSGGLSGAVSGHSMCAFGMAWLLSHYYPRATAYWFGMAAGVAWSRVYTEEHYPYQVVLGVVAGMISGFVGTHSADGIWCPRLFKRSGKAPRGLEIRTNEGLTPESA